MMNPWRDPPVEVAMFFVFRPGALLLLGFLAHCGISGTDVPEGFSQAEWRQEQVERPDIAQAHQWIDKSAARRQQRRLALEASYRAFAFSRQDPEGFLGDIRLRKRHYHQINLTWLPQVAMRAQRGEGTFGALLALQLDSEVQRCWNPKSIEALRTAVKQIKAL